MVTQMGQVLGGWVEKVDGIKKYKSPVIKTVPGCEVRHEEHGQLRCNTCVWCQVGPHQGDHVVSYRDA